jgi:hypothetical protein
MQPEEIYSHGSMAQYWHVIYAEYQRLHKALGRVPFKLTNPDPHIVNLAEFAPANSEPILFDLLDDDYRAEALSVDAEYSRHKQAVWIMVHDQGVEENRCSHALSIWEEIKKALKKAEKRRVIKTSKHKSQTRYGSLRKMLEKILYRDNWLAENKNAPPWSQKREDSIDKDTANKIDKEVGGLIKKRWYHTNVPGDVFANLIIKRYIEFPN